MFPSLIGGNIDYVLNLYKKLITPYRSNNENTLEWVIKDCENETEFQNKKLQLLKEKQSIIILIKMQGWEEFDVSNETEKDLEYTLSMNYIGTKSEYDIFKLSFEW